MVASGAQESEWNLLKADMEAQLAKEDKERAAKPFTCARPWELQMP